MFMVCCLIMIQLMNTIKRTNKENEKLNEEYSSTFHLFLES